MQRVVTLTLGLLVAIPAAASPRVERYESPGKVVLPAKFNRAKVVAVLQSTAWLPIEPMSIAAGPASKPAFKPLKLRFLRPSKYGAFMTGKPGERVVFVRRVEQRDAAILVEVDGEAWHLEACGDKKRKACLVPSAEPFEAKP